MDLWGAQHHKTFDDVLKYDDTRVLVEIRKDTRDENERSKWARRIAERRHHRRVLVTGDNADRPTLRRMRRIHRRLVETFPAVDFYLDDSPLVIHKLSVPGDQDEQKVDDLHIIEKDGKLKLMTQDSAIIGKIPKEVRTVRIFADAEEDVLDEIRIEARRMEREET